MAIAPTVLIAPAGPLALSLFPGDDSIALSTRVQAYIDSAYLDARIVAVGDADAEHIALQDRMARALSLYKAYDAVFQRMLAEPNAVNAGTERGSHAYTDKQREEMKAIRDGYLADFLGLVPEPAIAATVPTGTTSVPTVFRW